LIGNSRQTMLESNSISSILFQKKVDSALVSPPATTGAFSGHADTHGQRSVFSIRRVRCSADGGHRSRTYGYRQRPRTSTPDRVLELAWLETERSMKLEPIDPETARLRPPQIYFYLVTNTDIGGCHGIRV
jgi:hypothetical protein